MRSARAWYKSLGARGWIARVCRRYAGRRTEEERRVARISIGDAWEGASAFLMREWKLLLPVSLAFVGLPALVMALGSPQLDPKTATAADYLAIMPWALGSTLIGLVGTLATNALVLVPGISVGEALARAGRRFAVALATLVLIGLAGMAALVPLSLFAALAGKGGVALAILILAGLFGYVGIRMMMTNIVVAAEPVGPWQAITRSWALTSGHFIKLLGFAMLTLVAAMAVSVAVTLGGGVVAILIGKLLAMPQIAQMLTGILAALLNSFFSMVLLVVIVFLYYQLAGSRSGI